jgi:hypothetical protein
MICRHLLLREELGVVAQAQRAEIDADGPEARLLGLLTRPRLQLIEQRRLVRLGEVLLGGLQVRVAGTAEPDVELRVRLLGGELRDRLARALQREADLDPGLLLELGRDRVAPLGLHAADHVELLRRRRRNGEGGEHGDGGRDTPGCEDHD